MIVAKFGGSSLKDAEHYIKVADAVQRQAIPVVIASAPGGEVKVTDMLIRAYDEWLYSGKCGKAFDEVADRFYAISSKIGVDIKNMLGAIRAAVMSGAGYDYTVSRGEYLSAYLLSRLCGVNFIDARECVKLDMCGEVDYESVISHSANIKPPCVIPGFYGKMPNGMIRLLPRGGSDISGAAIAAALNGEYCKCTDVDGIFDGHGGIIDHLGYDEAELLCYFGATVMQYESMRLLKRANVKLTIKNAFSERSGTLVSDKRIDGYALSKKQMFLSFDCDEKKILSEGLKIAFNAELLGRKTFLIDGCGFSPLAIKRILSGSDFKPVTVTAVVGESKSEEFGKMLYGCEEGRIYIS